MHEAELGKNVAKTSVKTVKNLVVIPKLGSLVIVEPSEPVEATDEVHAVEEEEPTRIRRTLTAARSLLLGSVSSLLGAAEEPEEVVKVKDDEIEKV